jgi:hypothetical protein
MNTNTTALVIERTICDCPQCTIFCFSMPGMIAPSDLEGMIGESSAFAFADAFLLASEGALLMNRDTKETFRIPTLVFKTKACGECIFLRQDAKCGIHSKSPFGCAYLDTHMSERDAATRKMWALSSIQDDMNSNGLYSQLWTHLKEKGQTVKTSIQHRRGVTHA